MESLQPPSSNHSHLVSVPPSLVARSGQFPPAQSSNSEFNLRLFLKMLRRRIIVVTGVTGIAFAYSIWTALNQVSTYGSSFRLLVEPVNADNKLADLTGEGQSKQSNLDYDTQIQVLRSPELLAKITAQLETVYPGANYNFSPQALKIVRIGETKIIEVSYQSADPAEAKAVLDQASQVYLTYSLAERQTNLRQGVQFIEKQLPALQQRVNALQDELQTFRQRYNFSDPETQTSQISSQAEAIRQQQQEVEQKLLQARFEFSALKGETGTVAALSKAEAYQDMVSQLRQIETQIATELTRLQPQSLSIRVLEDKRQSLLPLLRQEAERSLGGKLADAAIQIQLLEVQKAALAQAEARLDVQTQQLPILSRNYVDLQRELQIASDSLNRFRTSRETLLIDAAQTEIPWELIQEPASPRLASNTDINRSLLMGILLSSALGVGAALGLEKLDSTYHSPEDLRDQTKLPVLGVLPFYKPMEESPIPALQKYWSWLKKRLVKRGKSRRQLRTLPSAPQFDQTPIPPNFIEALRVFYTNLQIVGTKQPLRSLVISSALSGDGKSTIAFHLAQTAQAMGQKVLLIDADLRRPQLHQWLNLTNQQGLSDVISGDASLKNVLIRSHPDAGFLILTAGTVPADPTQLLASARMRQLMEWCHRTFDLVIYDTPPLLGLADASLLASMTDGLLLVARLGKTDRVSLNQALDSLKVSNISVLGLVANGLQYQSFEAYHSYSDSAPE